MATMDPMADASASAIAALPFAGVPLAPPLPQPLSQEEDEEVVVAVPNKGPAPSLADYAPAVLRNYFASYPTTFLTQHHIQSYEAFMFREMLDIIHAENPLTILKEPINAELGLYKYKVEIFVGGQAATPADLKINVRPPVVTLDNGKTVRRMFPNEARIRGLTYAANFSADISVRVTFTTPDPAAPGKYITTVRDDLKFANYGLFNIPILLRSKLCATYGADKDLLWEMGECKNDQGGYFIIDGSEKLLITRQEQAFNSVFVGARPPNDPDLHTYASVVSQHPKTKQTHRVALYRMKSMKAGANVEDGTIRISIPFVQGAVPLFAVFRALGVESDEEIVRMILPDTSSALTSAMESTLIPSIHDAWPLVNQTQAIEFLRTLTKGFVVADILNILNMYLFSHVPNRPLARAQYLAEIVRKMIRVEMGLEPSTNRDDIRNQRLLPTGTLLRGLFSEAWKMWKKAVRTAVDTLYNYNKTLYQGEDFLKIFSPGSLNSVLSSKVLNDAIMRGYRGKWGTNEFNMKTGVIQPLARISFLDAMSHTRRVVSDFDTSMKLTGPRQLHPSQVGYFCTSETPNGAHIGATKNMSILTAISVAVPHEPVMNWLLKKGGVIEVSAASTALRATATSVQINGGTIGFTTDPGRLTLVLKLMKWTACLAPTASISFNTGDNILRIYLDDGRPLRPLYHLNEGKWAQVMLDLLDNPANPIPAWRDMVCGSLPLTAATDVSSPDFYDPLAERADVDLGDYIELLKDHVGIVEYIDPYEGNESYVSWWGRIDNLAKEHTHAEIHPSSLMGLVANMIPFANHNQSPRNQLSCSQSKQAIGYYATNFMNRFDTYGSMLCYGQGALCRSIVHEAVAGGGMPYGQNIIFALCCFNGYNQDDGILFNRSSIERGLFRSLALRSYETVEEDDPITKVEYRIGNPRAISAWTDLKPGNDYSALDEDGIIREGTVIHDKMVLVARYISNKENNSITDASLMPTVFTKGRVDKVVVLHQANGMRLVRVRILEERTPELGDKFSSRHGQKGTMGMLMDAVDLPRTADGMVPDVIVNPHCIPSRMTIAQLLEQVFGKFGAQIGAKMNSTSFMNDEDSFAAIADALQQVGLQREGEEILYSGMTGKMFTSSVFMGPLYFMRLKHLTQDKQNSRGAGRKEIRTHQPTGGRGNEGGMRIGEMERDTLISHGVTSFLQESMMKRSDGSSFWICDGCGTVPIYNEAQKLFLCPLCDGPLTYQGTTADTIGLVLPVKKSRATFSKIEIPYSLKLLDQEMTTFMNGGMRFLTEAGARKFREPTDMELPPVGEEEAAGAAGGLLEAQEAAVAAAAAAVSELPVAAGADKGAEDAPADVLDEDQPARNEAAEEAPVPAGMSVIEFSAKLPAYREFSSYYPVKLMLDGKVWPSVEHYFQAMKFPDNEAYQESIRLTKKPEVAKRMGKTEEVPVRPDWATYRDVVMLTAVKEKFSDRHPELKAKLLETGSAILKDASPLDNYWGIGRSKKGRNKLGEILMTVRGELQGGLPAAAAGAATGAVGGAGFQTMALDAMMTTSGVNEANAAAAAAAANAAAAGAAAGTTVVIQNAPVPAALTAPVLPTVPDAAAATTFPSAEEAAAIAANAGTFEALLPPQQAPPLAPLAAQGGGGAMEQQSPPVLKILEVNAQAPILGAAPFAQPAPLPVFTNTTAQQAAFVPQTAGFMPGAQQAPEPEYKTVTVHAVPSQQSTKK